MDSASPTRGPGIVRFTKVALEYPRRGHALLDVSFEVAKGEFVFLTGHSGAGKSTILKLVAMQERPTHGDVRVAGYSSTTAKRRDIPKLRRKLGIVFQDFRLLEDRSVEQNIAFALEVIGTPSGAIGPKVARLLTQVGLASKGTSQLHELSGGEQQRVAIARALVNDPMVLVADEPTGNLDAKATAGIFQLLRDINASGTAVLMATHDLSLIHRSGLRFLAMERGHLTYDGDDASRLAST
ncbi:MAG: cell division ATP-binding protein FtsE [Gemmatimonadaceae bacterium]|jgi:cell division transport system ATP-binding protein|nr:cell division ATP-binding protein FtsE [Gemmatimonadaceae bacterium]